MTLRPLWEHQGDMLTAIRRSIETGHNRPMAMAPTGFGKTLTAAHIIARARDRNKRVVFTVPAISLIDQTLAAFEAEGLGRIGVLQGLHPRTDPGAPIQIASVQTLVRRNRPECDLVIVDEAHLIFRALVEWMRAPEMARVPFIGLSATPWTRGLGKIYDDLIIAATTADLIERGFLSKFVVYAPSEPDLSAVAIVRGEYDEKQLSRAVDTPTLIGDVVETWFARARDMPTLVYGVDCEHALHLSQRFREAGVAAEYVDHQVDRVAREEIFARFRAGETRVICNVATLTTGIDLDVRAIVDARPTRSEMRYVQTIGRGLRTAPGKDRLVVLDHAGNVQRLGLVTDIHHATLDAGDQRKAADDRLQRKAADIRLCPECRAVMPRGKHICEMCGYEEIAKTAVTETHAELVEFGQTQTAERSVPSAFEQAQFFAELKGYAALRNYASGWAAHKFRERIGHWPNHPLVRSVEPQPPSLKTRNWITSRQIAFARSRKNG
jgi:DNA repair protein RadD